jgi:hypothetical protein
MDVRNGLLTDTVHMTISDYILDIALIGIVFLQIKGRRLTLRSLLLPFAIVGFVAFRYLHSIPMQGGDLLLIGGAALLGGLLGGLAGLFTSVKPDADGIPFAKAGVVAAVLWVLGVGSRFAFQLYVTHGGAESVGRFSIAHHITGAPAWTAALILMAIAEVALRSAVLVVKGGFFNGDQLRRALLSRVAA